MPGCLKILLAAILFTANLLYADAQYRFDQAIKLTKENRLPSDDIEASAWERMDLYGLLQQKGCAVSMGRQLKAISMTQPIPTLFLPAP